MSSQYIPPPKRLGLFAATILEKKIEGVVSIARYIFGICEARHERSTAEKNMVLDVS